MGSLLEERNVPLVEGHGGEVVASQGVDVLRDFFVAAGVGGQHLGEAIPLVEGGVSFLEVGQKDLLNKASKSCD